MAALFVVVAAGVSWTTGHDTEAASSRPEASSEAMAAHEGPGYLELDVEPRADVLVDGRSIGRTPLRKLELDPGQRRIRLVNAEIGLDTTIAVEVTSGETTRVRRRFDLEP